LQIFKKIFQKKEIYSPKIGDTIHAQLLYGDKFGWIYSTSEVHSIFIKTFHEAGQLLNYKVLGKESEFYSKYSNDKMLKKKQVLNAKMILVEKEQKWEI